MAEPIIVVRPPTLTVRPLGGVTVEQMSVPPLQVIVGAPGLVAVRPVPPEVVVVAGLPGATGATGPQGPPGGNYVHSQAVPATAWTVHHNLGYRPGGILIEDTLGRDVEGDIQHVDENTLIASFNAAFGGVLYAS